jgi:hypothetical protein
MDTDISKYSDAELLASIREVLSNEALLAEFLELCEAIRSDLRAFRAELRLLDQPR